MEDLERKKRLCEKLGALKFKKVVFYVEKLKFKVIEKCFPSIDVWFSNYCDKKVVKLCSKNISEEEKNNIRFNYNCKKMAFKKELIEKKNRNYHFNSNNASSFYKYLLWNKNVHKKGIIRDIIGILGSVFVICLSSGILNVISVIVLIYSLFSLGINFQCVNLQNYNICRFEEKKELLSKIEERKRKSDIKNYSNVSTKVYEKLKISVERPKSSEIVKSLTTKEQLEELRKLALEIKKQRNDIDDIKINVKGGV